MLFLCPRACNAITSWLILTALIGWLCDRCAASHFRGAHFWWRPWPEGNTTEVEINVRISWRRDYTEKTFCDDDVIASRELIGPVDAGYIMCVSDNCDDNIGNMDFTCTDYSAAEDWVSGLKTHRHQFQDNDVYTLRWRGRSWLEDVLQDKRDDVDWEFQTIVDLRPRPDTGDINASPMAAVGTLLRVQEGCEQTLELPVTDADGDRVVCRWAESKEECGGICGPVEGFTLDANTCSFTFAPTNKPKVYALAIQIEDYMYSDEEYGPLSSVPLQFIVQVYPKPESTDQSDTSYCAKRPEFIAPTPEADGCVTMQVNVEQSKLIVVRTKDEFTSINEINTVSSIGMSKSPLDRYGNDPRDYYVTITWTPVANDKGERIFCFSAVDSRGLSTDQRCIYLVIGEVSSPTPVPQRAYYVPEMASVYIEYSVTITLSTENKEISIFDASDTRVVQLDTSTVPSTSNNTLQIPVPRQLEGEYYILMQQGAVIAVTPCGRESDVVSEKHILAFTAAPKPTPRTDASTDDDDDDVEIWIIIVIVVAIVLCILLIIIVAMVIRHKRKKDKTENYDREGRQEEYIRNLQYQTKIVGYDGPYAPNFHDIEVKFR